MSDERSGLPSASAASRYAACLGSWQLETQVAEVESSGDAATGNRIHSALALEPVSNLTTDEAYIIERCQQQELELVKQVFANSTEEPQAFREKRLWSLKFDGSKLWSGKPDVVYVSGASALIIDYKSGRGSV